VISARHLSIPLLDGGKGFYERIKVPYKAVGVNTVKKIIRANFGPENKMTKDQAAKAATLVEDYAAGTAMGPRLGMFDYLKTLNSKAGLKQ
jgi:hypothetical protein